MGVTALIATVAALALPPLPSQGFAVARPEGVTLYDSGGRELAQLAGYRFVTEYVLNSELPRLRDSAGRRWRLDVRAHRLVRAERGLPLAGGATITFVKRRWVVRRGNRVLMQMLPRREFPYLDEDLRVVSTVRRALDLATGKPLVLPKGCVLASRRVPNWILLCGRRTYGTLLPTSIERLVDGRRQRIAGPAFTNPSGPAGYWVYVRAGSRGRLLAQWSGECESPAAFVIANGKRRPLGASSTESVALGWSDGRALVHFPTGVCGGTFHGGPGVYALAAVKPSRLVATTGQDRVAYWG
jgi:hypothetical protein